MKHNLIFFSYKFVFRFIGQQIVLLSLQSNSVTYIAVRLIIIVPTFKYFLLGDMLKIQNHICENLVESCIHMHFPHDLFYFMFTQPPSQQQTSCKHHMQSMAHQPQFHPVPQDHQPIHQSQHPGPYSHNHHCVPSSHLSEMSLAHQSPTISQQLPCLQQPPNGHVGGRLHIIVSSL